MTIIMRIIRSINMTDTSSIHAINEFSEKAQNSLLDLSKHYFEHFRCWIFHTVCPSNNLTTDKRRLVKCLISKHSHKRTACTLTYCLKRFCGNWEFDSIEVAFDVGHINESNASINDFLLIIPLNYCIKYSKLLYNVPSEMILYMRQKLCVYKHYIQTWCVQVCAI